MRLFVAVEVTDAVREAVTRILADLKAAAPHSRFVKPDKLHLTLQFLGAVEANRVEEITKAIDSAVSGAERLSLAYKSGGAFGSKHAPKVLWIGVEGDVPKLAAIQKKLEAALEPLGFKPEHRDYSPHLTLARAKNFRGDRELSKCVDQLAGFSVDAAPVTRVVLMESVQNTSGGEYRVVHAVDLK